MDRTFEAAGVAPIFNQSIAVTRARNVVAIIALYEKPLEFEPMKLTASGVRLVSTLAYETDVFESAIRLIADGQMDVAPVITARIKEEIVGKGFEALLNDKSQAKIFVKLSGE